MNKKILMLSSAFVLSLSFAATDANAGFFSKLKDAAESVEHKVEDAVKSVAKKLKGGAKKAFEKAKKVGKTFIIKAKHVGDFVKDNAKKYGPKGVDLFIKGVEKGGSAGLEAATLIKGKRDLFEPYILQAMQLGGPAAVEILQTAVSEIPAAGPVVGGVVGYGADVLLSETQKMIEKDLAKQSGEKVALEGYTAGG